jgi:hypothetical protein
LRGVDVAGFSERLRLLRQRFDLRGVSVEDGALFRWDLRGSVGAFVLGVASFLDPANARVAIPDEVVEDALKIALVPRTGFLGVVESLPLRLELVVLEFAEILRGDVAEDVALASRVLEQVDVEAAQVVLAHVAIAPRAGQILALLERDVALGTHELVEHLGH